MRKIILLVALAAVASMAVAQYTTLEWVAPEGTVTKYRIWKGDSELTVSLIDSVEGTPPDTFWTDDSITGDEDVTHYYEVVAVNDEGESDPSSALSVLVDITPNTPTQTYTSADSTITLVWKRLDEATPYSVAAADSYRIRYMYGAQPWTYTSRPVVADTVSLEIGTVALDTTYVVQAMAVYDGWPADWSTTVGDTVQVSTLAATSNTVADTLTHYYTGGGSVAYRIALYEQTSADPDTLTLRAVSDEYTMTSAGYYNAYIADGPDVSEGTWACVLWMAANANPLGSVDGAPSGNQRRINLSYSSEDDPTEQLPSGNYANQRPFWFAVKNSDGDTILTNGDVDTETNTASGQLADQLGKTSATYYMTYSAE